MILLLMHFVVLEEMLFSLHLLVKEVGNSYNIVLLADVHESQSDQSSQEIIICQFPLKKILCHSIPTQTNNVNFALFEFSMIARYLHGRDGHIGVYELQTSNFKDFIVFI